MSDLLRRVQINASEDTASTGRNCAGMKGPAQLPLVRLNTGNSSCVPCAQTLRCWILGGHCAEKKNRQTVHKKAKKVIEEFMVEEYKEYDSWGQDDDATSDSDTQPEAEAGAEAEADQSSVEDNEYDAWGRIQREALPTMDLYSMVQQQLGAAEDAEKGGRPTRKLLT